MAYQVRISDEAMALLYAKSKREGIKIDVLADHILKRGLWNEPEVLFKGKAYKVSDDLFTKIEPLDD
jgi:hypothetical protein